MPIKRCSCQNRQSLEEFYSELVEETNKISSDIGKAMLSILDFLNYTFLETKIYGLTSHEHLLLFSKNSIESDWYVVFIADGTQFQIEFKIPIEKQPWKDALIKGVTNSFEEFKKYIVIAMFESQGWKESEELRRLYFELRQNNLTV